ncbi:hypothetical protein ABH930_004487 [Kitasatospora sp. GAS204A]|uniref:hypothetical protein n=1 Tax=unclassified Kitasatospora TaxID=2633591 RepID=UPI0024738A46|nr:hypothetical protein [Kitasatospora sp. GAS204B]MDH6119726.1 hypothetical protein [Kitasatospora sp. GAS204B]
MVFLLAVSVTLSPLPWAARVMAAGTPVSKTGTDVATGSTTVAGHGDTVRWVTSYANPSPSPAGAVIADPIQGAGVSQTYVPGSLRVPPGFVGQWSTDGGNSFSSTDPGTATDVVQARSAAVLSPATATSTLLTAPASPVNTFTGGDGFIPIVYTATINGVSTPEIWNLYHFVATGPNVACTNRLTNGPCPSPTGAARNWPQPMNSSAVGALTGDVGSSLDPKFVVIGSKLYYPGVSSASGSTKIGVGCLDLQAQQSCGFTPLQTAVAGAGGNAVSGVVQTPNGKMYVFSSNGQILCFDPSSNGACGVFGIGMPADRTASTSPTPTGLAGTLDAIAGKVYVTEVNATSTGALIGCFDPAAGGACAGWTTPKTISTGPIGSVFSAYSLFTAYSPAGTATSVCSTVAGDSGTPPTGTAVCFDFAGNPVAAPPGLSTLLAANNFGASTVYMPPAVLTPPGHHLESLFPVWGGASNNICYDWVAQAACSSFGTGGSLQGPANVHGGDTRPYGYAFDGQCAFGLGDAGYLWSMDPITGQSPCVKTKATTTLDPRQFYCDGATGHYSAYGTLQLAGLTAANVDYASSFVTVTDSANNPIATLPINPATQSTDLSAVPVTTTAPITVRADIALNNTSDFTTNTPSMTVTFVGDPVQMCFQTIVANDCTITSIADQSTQSTTGFPPTTSNTVTLQVPPGPTCRSVPSTTSPPAVPTGGTTSATTGGTTSAPTGGTTSATTATSTGPANTPISPPLLTLPPSPALAAVPPPGPVGGTTATGIPLAGTQPTSPITPAAPPLVSLSAPSPATSLSTTPPSPSSSPPLPSPTRSRAPGPSPSARVSGSRKSSPPTASPSSTKGGAPFFSDPIVGAIDNKPGFDESAPLAFVVLIPAFMAAVAVAAAAIRRRSR